MPDRKRFHYTGYITRLKLVRTGCRKELYAIRFPRDVYTLFERLPDEACKHFR